MATLVASKDQMLQGFKSLTENRIPEPLNRLDEIISHLDQQIEQLLGPLSARNKTRFGKTKMTASKVSSRGRKGKAQGEGSVAFRWMGCGGVVLFVLMISSFFPLQWNNNPRKQIHRGGFGRVQLR